MLEVVGFILGSAVVFILAIVFIAWAEVWYWERKIARLQKKEVEIKERLHSVGFQYSPHIGVTPDQVAKVTSGVAGYNDTQMTGLMTAAMIAGAVANREDTPEDRPSHQSDYDSSSYIGETGYQDTSSASDYSGCGSDF